MVLSGYGGAWLGKARKGKARQGKGFTKNRRNMNRKLIVASVTLHKKLKVLAAQEGINVKELLEVLYENYVKGVEKAVEDGKSAS